MIQVSNIRDAFGRYKTDITDVSSTVFIEWVQFVARYIYKNTKAVDPMRFIQSQLYSVVYPPQTFSLPTNFQDLNQTACGLFKYDTRKRKIATFESAGDAGVTFIDNGGTSAYNSYFYVEGQNSRGFTNDAAADMSLSFATPINWADFADRGATSRSNDYVSIYVFIDGAIPASITLEFSTSSAGTDSGANAFSHTTSSGLALGWNQIKVAKNSFTQVGTVSWNSLGYLKLSYTGGTASTGVYYDKLELIENELNGRSQTDTKIGNTWYGAKREGYYLDGMNIVFTNASTLVDNDYMMRYLPSPPTITSLTDYFTVDATVTGAQLVEDENMEYLVKAIDVLYCQWDVDPSSESTADFRFVRALGSCLSGINRTPTVSTMYNPSSDF